MSAEEIIPCSEEREDKEIIIDCVVFYYEEGKKGEEFRKKISFVARYTGRMKIWLKNFVKLFGE